MNKRTVIAIAVAVLALAAAFAWWRGVHVKRPRIIFKKRAEAPVAIKRKASPPVEPARDKAPKVAIVLDDFGYNRNNLDALFSINEPVTLSVLPNLSYSREVADMAKSRGYEVILHLPLEAHRKDVREEAGTIRSAMSDEEILALLSRAIAGVPGLVGVSNHMGSKATEDERVMSVIFDALKKKGLYFFDSLTSQRSVCRDAAARAGLKVARRDIFLDIPNDAEYIEKQLDALKALAIKRGRAIAVGHDRKNTVTALKKMMPEMAKEGIEFVRLSELVK